MKQSELLEDFSRRSATELPLPVAPERAKGQTVKTDWDVRIVNVVEFARWAFASGRWECLDISLRKTAVKELLRGGMKSIPGLECKEVTTSGVRAQKQKSIDV